MGIRIHKSLGWGTNKANQHWNSKTGLSELLNEENGDYKSFCKWYEKNKKDILAFYNDGLYQYSPRWKEVGVWGLGHVKEQKKTKGWDVRDHIVDSPFDNEGGNPKRIQFLAIGNYDWKRYDNSIDYIEAGGEAIDNFKYIPNSQGIYPYVGMHPFVKVPKTHDFDKYHLNPHTPSDYAMLVGTWAKRCKPIATGEELKELKTKWRPHIPIEVAIFAYYIKDLLKDPLLFANSLRPSIYTYWS